MNNNPFAKIFKSALIDDVLSKSILLSHNNSEQTPSRIKIFLEELNRFFMSSGEVPVHLQNYAINEKALLSYALFLRGYMRDAQKVLQNIESKYTCDTDMLRLFEASSHYAVVRRCRDSHAKDYAAEHRKHESDDDIAMRERDDRAEEYRGESCHGDAP